MADKALQDRIDNILSSRGKGEQKQQFLLARSAESTESAEPRRLFSAFVNEDVEKASALAREFIETANKEGLEASLGAIEKAMEQEPIIGLVQHAVKLFLIHHPEARTTLKLKPLEVRQPNLVVPSEPPAEKKTEALDENLESAAPSSATPPENLVNFWREDPLINEHHEHWHLVYPTSPVDTTPEPVGGYDLGDRHGELFAYMHEQMLARYDAERIALKIGRVEPFDTNPATAAKLTAPIPQGYDPGNLMLWDGGEWYKFRARPAGATISDMKAPFNTRPGAKIASQVDFINRLFNACDNGNYQLLTQKTPVYIDNLGNTVEANYNSVDFPQKDNNYGNVHNDGHIHLMNFDNVSPYGVMAQTATAVRDPVFFRWHKLVDDIYDEYRKNQKAHDFSDAPKVKIRKSKPSEDNKAASIDIILSLESGLPDAINGNKFGSTAYNNLAAAAFNDANWDGDFTAGRVKLASGETITTTDELPTEMLTRNINIEDEDGSPQTQSIEYLSHDDFYYFIRVQNNLDEAQTVVARVFLAPEDEMEDRRMWIELDKFSCSLKAKERSVLLRQSDQSSVVRKPGLKPADLTANDGASPAREAQAWCDCGWAYTMLLPRGTKEGLRFRLVVMFSNGDDLIMPDHPECCTAISYCGLQDVKYPDKAPMGFPFDRNFDQPIAVTVDKYDNWASRTITIRCKNL